MFFFALTDNTTFDQYKESTTKPRITTSFVTEQLRLRVTGITSINNDELKKILLDESVKAITKEKGKVKK